MPNRPTHQSPPVEADFGPSHDAITAELLDLTWHSRIRAEVWDDQRQGSGNAQVRGHLEPSPSFYLRVPVWVRTPPGARPFTRSDLRRCGNP